MCPLRAKRALNYLFSLQKHYSVRVVHNYQVNVHSIVYYQILNQAQMAPPQMLKLSKCTASFPGLPSPSFSLEMGVILHCTYSVSLQSCPRRVAAAGELHSREHLPPQLDCFALILYLIKCKQKDITIQQIWTVAVASTMQSFKHNVIHCLQSDFTEIGGTKIFIQFG